MSIVKINLVARLNEAGALHGKLEGKKAENVVELSENAKVLFAAEKAKKLEAIRAKVKADFYSRPEVKEKVVEGLLRDLQNVHV